MMFLHYLRLEMQRRRANIESLRIDLAQLIENKDELIVAQNVIANTNSNTTKTEGKRSMKRANLYLQSSPDNSKYH